MKAPEITAPILFRNTMRVAEGRWDEFSRAIRGAVEFAYRSAPQLMVQTFADAGGGRAHSFQLYADSDAIRAHWRLSATHIDDVMEYCAVERLDVYGEPDRQVIDTLRSTLGGVPLSVHPRMAGFTRYGYPASGE